MPGYLTAGFIDSLLPDYRFFMKRWNSLKTGGSIRLEFPENGEGPEA